MYTEEQYKKVIKDTVRATMEGMMAWLESDNVFIQTKDTQELIPNAEIEANIGPLENYINPKLVEIVGITYVFE